MRVLPLAIAAALALPAYAQAQPADEATDLDDVIVTATRTAISANDALAPVEVITSEDIARSQARSLPDLLRGRAGISIGNQGGLGKLTTLSLRGSETDHVLVLVDGVRIGSPTSGLASFQDLPMALIDRVEIVRGPRSSLYGADAVGGVIQIFTRRDRGAVAPRASVTVGSNSAREASAGVGGRVGRGWFGVDAAYQRTDGINACDGSSTLFAGCFTEEPDRDGYRNRSLSVRGGFDASDALSFEGHALRAEGDNEYDGSFVNYSEVVQQVIGGKAVYRPSDAVRVQLSAGRNRDASDNFLGSVANGYFATDRDTINLQGDFGVGEGQLLSVGFDWLRDRVDSDTAYDETERDNRAVFVQYQGRFGNQSIEASLRRDDNEQFDGHTTGSVAWGLGFGEGWRVTAGYGTAFKAPTFNELYYPFFNNPNLRPEESKTWEVGLAYRGERFNARIDAFQTDVDDLIAYDSAIFRPNNIDSARLRGAEIGFDANIDEWSVAASASFLDSENRLGFYAGNELPRRAKRSARIDVDRAFGDFRLGLTAVGSSARYDDVANSRRVGGYGTVDLRAEYALTPSWTLQARLANVFDRDYETISFYNQPGREWFLTVRYAPGK
ncbi:TonB-dependent vitamin B12 receptor [Lysobacter silvisoli]|nr:TonB-dependent vitamin B12 receptor [Lysobacter silvisoli]